MEFNLFGSVWICSYSISLYSPGTAFQGILNLPLELSLSEFYLQKWNFTIAKGCETSMFILTKGYPKVDVLTFGSTTCPNCPMCFAFLKRRTAFLVFLIKSLWDFGCDVQQVCAQSIKSIKESHGWSQANKRYKPTISFVWQSGIQWAGGYRIEMNQPCHTHFILNKHHSFVELWTSKAFPNIQFEYPRCMYCIASDWFSTS